MDARRHELTLDDFIVEMSREPISGLAHSWLMDLSSRLTLSDELIDGRTRFAAESYARNLVCRTPYFELLVLCWRPGQASTIHDHAGALNAIRVHSGELTSRVFAFRPGAGPGTGPVRQVAQERVRPGASLVGVDRNGIHQLANTSADDLVTLHVYAPALMELNVYSTESPRMARRPLRYTLEQDLE
jgi:predicted metal-dependent enzyme (double-stranded beta helix superfamily)